MIVKVNTKRLDFKNDLSNKKRLFFLIGLSIFLVTLAFFLTFYMRAGANSNPIFSAFGSAFTILISSLIIIFWIAWPGKTLDLSIEDDVLHFDGLNLDIKNIVSWALLDHGEILEIILNKGGLGSELIYFYAPKEELQNSGILDEFYEKIPYDQNLTEINKIHSILRQLNLR